MLIESVFAWEPVKQSGKSTAAAVPPQTVRITLFDARSGNIQGSGRKFLVLVKNAILGDKCHQTHSSLVISKEAPGT